MDVMESWISSPKVKKNRKTISKEIDLALGTPSQKLKNKPSVTVRNGIVYITVKGIRKNVDK